MFKVLPPHYRLQIKNETGQTLASSSVTIKTKRHKLNNSGELTYESSEATLATLGSVASNAYAQGSTIDNTSDKYLGGTFMFSVTAPASANGNVILYLQASIDGGSTYDDDGLGVVLSVLNFTTSGTKKKHFRI